MKYPARIYYTESDKALMWDRWQRGESLSARSTALSGGGWHDRGTATGHCPSIDKRTGVGEVPQISRKRSPAKDSGRLRNALRD